MPYYCREEITRPILGGDIVKKPVLMMVLVLSVCSALSCGTHDKESADSPVLSQEQDERAIRSAEEKWVQLYNAGQYDSIMSILYTEDAVLMAPDVPIYKGRDAILGSYLRDADLNDEHVDSSVVEDVRICGDLAVARGWDIGTTIPKSGGKPERYSLKWLIVLERQKDGTWKFAYEMWSENGPPQ